MSVQQTLEELKWLAQKSQAHLGGMPLVPEPNNVSVAEVGRMFPLVLYFIPSWEIRNDPGGFKQHIYVVAADGRIITEVDPRIFSFTEEYPRGEGFLVQTGENLYKKLQQLSRDDLETVHYIVKTVNCRNGSQHLEIFKPPKNMTIGELLEKELESMTDAQNRQLVGN
ncbi:MAG: hypothetical protein WC508_01485 [Patescibacteria group bacterium]